MTLLRAEGLSKRFGGLRAVDGVDLSLAAGEIVGVIGPNGAGKTTLFALLAGSLAPSAGSLVRKISAVRYTRSSDSPSFRNSQLSSRVKVCSIAPMVAKSPL